MSQIDPDFASIPVHYADLWVNDGIIESLTHGMYTALLAVVIWQILSNITTHRWPVKVLVGISVFMYIMATIHLATVWFHTRRAIITKGQTEETGYLALADWVTTVTPVWAMMINDIAAGMNIFVADGVIIWRCWIIWGKNWRIIVLPCLCTIGGLIFGISCLLQLREPMFDSQGHPKTTSTNWGLAYYVMALPATIICTTLIVYRLAKAIKTKNSPHYAPDLYYRVIEILVESSALYIFVQAIFIVFDAMNSPYSSYPQAVLQSVTGIAPTLMLLRVVSTKDTDTGPLSDNIDSRPLQPLPRSETEGGETRVDNDEVMIIGPEKMVQVV
ncbi:uncharacterized protein EV420DRAFT_1585598 [Desarmillaria tabescens]|uniref:Uncharacterized protein n=1 Tax=Armillaria tabescens TaxID=1929756 RepID=A0AA39JA65_ARMTA|nr:uncharacterized protein EV420DRAFT_1585598 [Desarmillaria tabescens]KAK0438539.1 hypothetical protein EV420DRAFT_1585598 [Desarmillaria tabescens]